MSTANNAVNDKRPTMKRVAIIGAGVSGVAAANVWQQSGYSVTVYEASPHIGGQWNKSYPGVHLQNTAPQYQFADFPWPFKPDRHPSGEQVLKYIHAAVKAFKLDVKLQHRITDMQEHDKGWTLTFNNKNHEDFCHVVIATGQYPGGSEKLIPTFKGLSDYQGQVVTNIDSHAVFAGKRVAVVGFGKTALDFSSFSASTANSTTHIFRTPRWTIPDTLLGIDFTRPLFARFGSDMMPSWCHSSRVQKFLHRNLRIVVHSFWRFIATLFHFQHQRNAKLPLLGSNALDTVIPPKSQFIADLRSATAVAPEHYYKQVADGDIRAIHSTIETFYKDGLILANGEKIVADMVCLCCGNTSPSYDFLPQKYRELLESESGGPALYRHIIHPNMPNLSFAGYNHGFLHIALCEMGALWAVGVHKGDLQLPTPQEMHDSAQRVASWKRDNSSFEESYNISVSTRYQQYLDILLQDMGISQWRKLPNIAAEIFSRYDPTDYQGVVTEYHTQAEKRREKGITRRPKNIDT